MKYINRERYLQKLIERRKIVIVGEDIVPYTDENGISYIGLMQFLLSDQIL